MPPCVFILEAYSVTEPFAFVKDLHIFWRHLYIAEGKYFPFISPQLEPVNLTKLLNVRDLAAKFYLFAAFVTKVFEYFSCCCRCITVTEKHFEFAKLLPSFVLVSAETNSDSRPLAILVLNVFTSLLLGFMLVIILIAAFPADKSS